MGLKLFIPLLWLGLCVSKISYATPSEQSGVNVSAFIGEYFVIGGISDVNLGVLTIGSSGISKEVKRTVCVASNRDDSVETIQNNRQSVGPGAPMDFRRAGIYKLTTNTLGKLVRQGGDPENDLDVLDYSLGVNSRNGFHAWKNPGDGPNTCQTQNHEFDIVISDTDINQRAGVYSNQIVFSIAADDEA